MDRFCHTCGAPARVRCEGCGDVRCYACAADDPACLHATDEWAVPRLAKRSSGKIARGAEARPLRTHAAPYGHDWQAA